MNINILRYSFFGIAGGQEVDRNFSQIAKLCSNRTLDHRTDNVFKQ